MYMILLYIYIILGQSVSHKQLNCAIHLVLFDVVSCHPIIVQPNMRRRLFGCQDLRIRYHKRCYAFIQLYRRAARFIFNYYSCLASINKMLTENNWATLTHNRKQKAGMLYKIVYQLVDIPASNYLTPSTISDITRGHHKRFLQPPSTVNAYLYSFFRLQ